MSFQQRVINAVRKIPKGRVATYGQVAALAGSPRAARTVGWILARSAEDVPWQRVINSKGRISIVNMEYPPVIQAKLLEAEGVRVEKREDDYVVDLEHYLWQTFD